MARWAGPHARLAHFTEILPPLLNRPYIQKSQKSVSCKLNVIRLVLLPLGKVLKIVNQKLALVNYVSNTYQI